MSRFATAYLQWLRTRWKLGTVTGFGPSTRVSVLVVLFHGLYRDRREAASGVCDPQQGITVAFFRQFVETLLAQGISILELEHALNGQHDSPVAALSFDDGYRNNAWALDTLSEFEVPATFFISTGHVEEQKAFWWDTLYREASARGAGAGAIQAEGRRLKRLQAAAIDDYLTKRFGARALQPVSDVDRPFTRAELADFARSPHVTLGNHTKDHAILVNYDDAGMADQIGAAQHYLEALCGRAPRGIAYPNGDYDARVIQAAYDIGLTYGLTLRVGPNTGRESQMELRRVTPWSMPPAHRQAKVLAGRLR